MHLRAMLLGSVAAMSVCFAPEGLASVVATSRMQSYDPTLPHYISPEAAANLPADVQATIDTAPAVVTQATLDTALVAEPLKDPAVAVALSNEPISDAEWRSSVEARLAALETGTGQNEKASKIIEWADKVLHKYYGNVNDRPEGQPVD